MNSEYEHPIRFLILFLGRTGSTFLVEALDSHSAIWVRGEELFGPNKKGATGQILWVRELLTQQHTGCLAVGFKTKLCDILEHEQTAVLLRKLASRIIFMEGRNVIKHTVSVFNSVRIHQATGDWNLYSSELRILPSTIDPEHFCIGLERLENQIQQLNTYVDSLQLPTLVLYYEDLLTKRQAAFDRVCSFLGVETRRLQVSTLKATSDNLREAIANFDDLRSRYVGSPYEQMFDEVLIPRGAP